MPVYEYECPKHGRFEVRQSMDTEREAYCPECGEPANFRISLPNSRIAIPFTVVNSEGRVVHHRGDGGNVLPPVEDFARDVKKEFDHA